MLYKKSKMFVFERWTKFEKYTFICLLDLQDYTPSVGWLVPCTHTIFPILNILDILLLISLTIFIMNKAIENWKREVQNILACGFWSTAWSNS